MPRRKKPADRINKAIEAPLSFTEFNRQKHEENLSLLRYAATRSEIRQREFRLMIAEDALKPERGTAFSHSEDYRSVALRGETFNLTPRQAQIIELLHQAIKDGHPVVSQATILEKLEGGRRLRDSFRKDGKTIPAWGTLIRVGEGKGTYRLNF